MTSIKRRATAAAIVATAAIGSLGFAFQSPAQALDNGPATPNQCAAYKAIYDANKGPGLLGKYADNIKETARLRGCDTSTWLVARPLSVVGGVIAPTDNWGPVAVMP
jgi:hypothetical protein